MPPTERGIGAGLPRRDGFYYIAGWAVPDGTGVPDGMEQTVIPPARYFKVHFHDQAHKIRTAFTTVFCELLPASGLTPVYGPVCFEDYPPTCHDPVAGTLKCDLYVQLT